MGNYAGSLPRSCSGGDGECTAGAGMVVGRQDGCKMALQVDEHSQGVESREKSLLLLLMMMSSSSLLFLLSSYSPTSAWNL